MRLGEFPDDRDQEKTDAVDSLAHSSRELNGKEKKEIWSELDEAGKKQYFQDYMLPKIVIAAVIIAAALFLIVNFALRGRSTTALYVVTLDDPLETDQKKELQDELEELLGDGKSGDNRNQIILDDSKYLAREGLSQTEVLMYNRQADVIISERTVFESLAANGDFLDLSEAIAGTDALSDEEKEFWKERFVLTAGYLDSDDPEDDGTGKGPEEAYGIRLSDTRYMELSTALTDPVFGIVANTEREEAALTFLKTLEE